MIRDPEPGFLANDADREAWTDALAAARQRRRRLTLAGVGLAVLGPVLVFAIVVGPERMATAWLVDDAGSSPATVFDGLGEAALEARLAGLVAELRVALEAADGDPNREERIFVEQTVLLAGDAELLARLTAVRVDVRRQATARESAEVARAAALVADGIDGLAEDGARRYRSVLDGLDAIAAPLHGQTARAEVARLRDRVAGLLREARGVVYVSGGPRGGPRDAARPVEAFAIDAREVSNAEWGAFLAAAPGGAIAPPPSWSGASPPVGRELHPVEGVSRDDARRFAGWRASRTGRATRLPSLDEWIRAATGGDGRRWPWGDEFVVAHANLRGGAGGGASMLVGSLPFGRSPFGCYHLVGNVAEWVDDDAARRLGAAAVRVDGSDGPVGIVVGGSYRAGVEASAIGGARLVGSAAREAGVGFRCVEAIGD